MTFDTGIPNIRVIIREASDENLTAQVPNVTVKLQEGAQYNVNMVPNTVSPLRTGSFNSYADLAGNAWTASYALVAQTLLGSVQSASYATTASSILGGTENYIPLWATDTTLSSSRIFQTQSSILIGATTQHTPEAPDTLGIFAETGSTSYNLISGHGNVDSYLQLNIKNFSGGTSASADIVATADVGTETSGYVDMGINSSGYINNGNGIGDPLDAYLYTQDAGNLLIGNKSADKKVVIFTGQGDAIQNARVLIDPSGSVGINSSQFDVTNPEALLVQAINDQSYNLIRGTAAVDNYIQFNIQNISTGYTASSDVVATANNGTETSNYIDMGINNSQYSIPNAIGGPNDAYLYSTGNHLHIGNTSAGQDLMLFVGGFDVEAATKLTLRDNNQHILSGSLTITEGATGSLYGTASWALNAVTASYISGAASTWNDIFGKPNGLVSSSVQINTGSFTGSFIGQLTGTGSWAQYAVSASYISGSSTVGPGTSQSIALFNSSNTISSSVIFQSGSNIGIGATTPARRVEIAGDGTGTAQLRLTYVSGQSGLEIMSNAASIGELRFGVAGGASNLGQVTYNNANNSMAFFTNAGQRVTIDSSGRMGIGITSPTSLLHVSGANNTTPVRVGIGNFATYDFSANSTSGYITTFNMDDTGSSIGHNSSTRDLQLRTNSTARLTILGGGNVGIGTTSPSSLLHVSASGTTNDLLVGSTTVPKLFISASGNVGIGTNNPLTTLHVAFGSSGQPLTNLNGFVVENNGTSNAYNAFQVATAGGGRSFAVTNAGNVGIGVVTPTEKLQIQGNVSGSSYTSSINNGVGYFGTASWAQSSSIAAAANSITFTTFSNASYYFPQNLRVEGTLTAQVLQTEYVTSSIIYESGSTKFGDSSDDTHQFTGSLQVLGSITGSLAGTSSYAQNANLLDGLDSTIFATTGSNTFRGTNIFSGSVTLRSDNILVQIEDTDTTTRYAGLAIGHAGGNWILSAGDNLAGINNDFWIGRSTDSTNNRVRVARDTYTLSVYSGSNENVILNATGSSYFTGGSVGIGTSSPAAILDISQATNDALLRVRSTGAGAYVMASSNDSNYFGFILASGSSTTTTNDRWFIGSYGSPGDLTFTTGRTGTEYMRIVRSTGRVGIGTTSPSATLQVSGSQIIDGTLNVFDSGSNNFPLSIGFNNRITSQYIRVNSSASTERGLAFSTAGNLRWITYANSSTESTGDAGSNFAISAYNDAGTVIDTPFSIVRAAAGVISLNRNIRILTGSVGTPVISPTADTNTGIYFPAPDNIGFVEGGTEAMRIDSSANVGIGITAPTAKLDIGGAIDGNVQAVFTRGNDGLFQLQAVNASAANTSGALVSKFGLRYSGSGDAAVFKFYRGGGAQDASVAIEVNGGTEALRAVASGRIGIGTTSPATLLHVSASGTTNDLLIGSTTLPKLFVSGAGNIGIGTTSPDSLVHLHATSGGDVPRLRFTNGSTGATTTDGGFVGISNSTQVDLWNFENDAIRLGTNNSVRLTILGGGNVGIGTTSPSAPLHVQGNVSASSYTSSISNAVGFFGTASWAQSASVASGFAGTANRVLYNNASNVTTTSANLTFDGTNLTVGGQLNAATKSFLINHKTKPGKKLVYGVVEGPEHSVFVRGRLTGKNTIVLPNEWDWLVDLDSITVQLTPIGKPQKLYVKSIDRLYITVENGGFFSGPIDCYYFIQATRKDVEPLQTVV